MLRGVVDNRWAAPGVVVEAMHTLGVARLQQGQVEEGLTWMEAARASGWFETLALRRHRGVVLQGQAMALTVLGRVDEARVALERARGLARGPVQHAHLDLVSLLLAVREERWDDIVERGRAPTAHLPVHGIALWDALQVAARRAQGEEVTVTLAPADAPRWLPVWPGLAEHLRVSPAPGGQAG